MALTHFTMSFRARSVNPFVTNGLSHPYHLDESTFVFRGVESNVSLSFLFSMKFMSASRIAADGMQHFAASHLGLFCLPMSHKRTPGLYGLTWARGYKTIYAELS